MNTAKIIAMTEPYLTNEDDSWMTADEFIAYVARVSNPSNQNNTATAPKLVQYLIKNQHWSPLEMVHVSMEIRTTRDIARQILRHRSFMFQEYSQRYADPTKSLDFTTREARLQDNKTRQNSIENENEDLEKTWTMKQTQLIHYTMKSLSYTLKTEDTN
jgi:thymidylate synthase (FAD)